MTSTAKSEYHKTRPVVACRLNPVNRNHCAISRFAHRAFAGFFRISELTKKCVVSPVLIFVTNVRHISPRYIYYIMIYINVNYSELIG